MFLLSGFSISLFINNHFLIPITFFKTQTHILDTLYMTKANILNLILAWLYLVNKGAI